MRGQFNGQKSRKLPLAAPAEVRTTGRSPVDLKSEHGFELGDNLEQRISPEDLAQR